MSAAASLSPRFVPCHPNDEMRAGFHIARRHDWEDPQRFEVVWLEVWDEGTETRFNLWRCGGSKPENPMDWAFQLRIGGFRSMPEDPMELKAVGLH